jgi:uncharacterized membrane protein
VSETLIKVRQSKTRLMFGILLCSLVCLFFTSAKLATYRHSTGAKQIASMKLSQKIAAPDLQAAPQILVSSPVWLAFLAMTVAAFAVIVVIFEEKKPAPGNSWFSPYLAVRPPPTR